MLAFFEVKCSCDLNSTYSTFMINAVHFLFCHPDAGKLLGGISCGYKEKAAGKTDRRKCLSWLCMGLGKFHNWKPFLKSESHSKDSWLSWEERRKGREGGESGYVCFRQQRAPGASKFSDTPETALLPRVQSPCPSGILLYPCPHPQTFCPMLKSDLLNSILITIICFQRKWKTNSLNVLEWIIPYCKVWDFKWMSSIRLWFNSVSTEHIFLNYYYSERVLN